MVPEDALTNDRAGVCTESFIGCSDGVRKWHGHAWVQRHGRESSRWLPAMEHRAGFTSRAEFVTAAAKLIRTEMKYEGHIEIDGRADPVSFMNPSVREIQPEDEDPADPVEQAESPLHPLYCEDCRELIAWTPDGPASIVCATCQTQAPSPA